MALPLRIAGVDKKLIAGKVEALLDLVGLADKRDAYPAQLSGGQKQRVGIARALVHDPEILLCDEATSALDPETTLSILDLLRDINRRLGLTIILITHEMAVVRQIADRVAVLDQGEVVELGPVWSIFADPQSETTRRLLRSVIADVPRDISDRLRYTPVAAGDVLLRVHLSDRANGLGASLDGLADVLSRPVRLLQADLDRIQGRSQGSLLLITEFRSTSDTEALVRNLRGKTAAVEVLGYVESTVSARPPSSSCWSRCCPSLG
uniref:methionine ABC transporter ATP-binding protein n=1 Tax=Elstera litoralis TaxID=552518 RepID=UPI0038B90981